MKSNTTADATASGAGEAESLGARIRREGDLSSRSGQLARLYGLADEADTLRAQLEAAEAECARLREDSERYLWLRNEAHPDSDSGLAVSFQTMNSWGNWHTQYPSGQGLESAIDAARKAATP